MTEHSIEVESPFAKRHVQGTFVAVAIMLSAASILSSGHANNDLHAVGGIEFELNRVEARELALVPGVGPVLAARIIANRDQDGDFSSLTDLLRVPGIGPRKLEQIEQLCVVDQQNRSKPQAVSINRSVAHD